MGDHEAKTPGVSLTNTAYNVLRRVVEVVLPAAGVLYSALALLWGWGYVAEVVGTIGAATVFLAAVLGLSRKNYQEGGQYDGEVILDESDPEVPMVRLQPYPGKLQEALTKDKLTFKGYTS